MIGSVKNDNFVEEEMTDLLGLRKPSGDKKKKNKRHKTNFKIPMSFNIQNYLIFMLWVILNF